MPADALKSSLLTSCGRRSSKQAGRFNEPNPRGMQGVEGKRIAALLSDGFEEIELTEPFRALEEAGAIVTIVGLDDRSRTRIRAKRDLDEGTSAKAEELVADCTAEDFDGLLIPGGFSPDRLRTSAEVQRLVGEFDVA